MVNKVIIVGNLGKDPEVRHFEGGSSVAQFSVATSETYTDKNGERQKQTEWHNVVLWGGLAGVAEKYLKKGNMVYVEGKLTTRKWQDKDGNDRYTTEVVGRTMKMLGGKESSGGSYTPAPSAADVPKNTTPASTAPATNTSTTTATTDAPAGNVADAVDDDLPF